MASITIRGLEDSVKAKLKARAAKHGRSMEGEARELIRCGVAPQGKQPNLVESIRARFAPLGFVELPEYPRREISEREPPDFE